MEFYYYIPKKYHFFPFCWWKTFLLGSSFKKDFLCSSKWYQTFEFNGKSFETNFYFLMYFQHVIVIRSDPQESFATIHPGNVYVRKEWLDINSRDLMSHLVSVSINKKDFLFNAFIDVIFFHSLRNSSSHQHEHATRYKYSARFISVRSNRSETKNKKW